MKRRLFCRREPLRAKTDSLGSEHVVENRRLWLLLLREWGWGSGGRGETHIGGGDRPLRTLEAEIGFSLTTGAGEGLQGLAPSEDLEERVWHWWAQGLERRLGGGETVRRKPERVL